MVDHLVLVWFCRNPFLGPKHELIFDFEILQEDMHIILPWYLLNTPHDNIERIIKWRKSLTAQFRFSESLPIKIRPGEMPSRLRSHIVRRIRGIAVVLGFWLMRFSLLLLSDYCFGGAKSGKYTRMIDGLLCGCIYVEMFGRELKSVMENRIARL